MTSDLDSVAEPFQDPRVIDQVSDHHPDHFVGGIVPENNALVLLYNSPGRQKFPFIHQKSVGSSWVSFVCQLPRLENCSQF